MAITLYRWDDVGAPTLSADIGSMIALLSACLVDGYGSKAGAGWTKPFTAANVACFRQGGGNQAFLQVTDTSSSATGVRVCGFSTMSDAVTGADPFPTEAQMAGGLYWHKSSTITSVARAWALIADDRRFYLTVDKYQSAGFSSVTAGYVQTVFFGDLLSDVPGDAFGTLLIGSHSTTTTDMRFGSLSAGGLVARTTELPGHYLCRSYTQTGESVPATKFSGAGGSVMGRGGTPYPDPVTGGMILSPIYVGESATGIVRGRLPGAYDVLHETPGNTLDTFTGAPGSALAGLEMMLLDAHGTLAYNSSTAARGRFALQVAGAWS